MDLPDGLGVDPCAAIGKLVPVHAGNDRVLQLHGRYGFGHPSGLFLVQGRGHSVGDATVLAGPGADVPEDHEGGGPCLPALSDVGASRLFTHRVEGLGPHQLLQLQVFLPPGERTFSQPGFRALSSTV